MKKAAPLRAAFSQSLLEAWAGGAGLILPVGFFAGTAMLVPFTVGSDAEILNQVGQGTLLLALAIASLVTLERILQSDLEDGALDLWIQSETSISMVAAVKVFAHWLISGLPLVLLTPLLAVSFSSDLSTLPQTMVCFAIAGLTFFLWGGLAAALSASVARGGLLIALIAIPFYFPTLILAAVFLQNPDWGETSLLLLVASSMFAIGIAPIAMGAALRLAAD